MNKQESAKAGGMDSFTVVHPIYGDLVPRSEADKIIEQQADTIEKLTNERDALQVDNCLYAAQESRQLDEAHEQLTAAQSRIAELEAAQEWHPIETAPRDGTAFFACMEGSNIPHAMRFDHEGNLRLTWDGYLVGLVDYPTQWSPIPASEYEKGGAA